MTYNVGNGLARPKRLIPLLRSCDADLIGLQELSAAQAEAIHQELYQVYPHQNLYPGSFEGRGILSRFPIRSVEQLHLYPERPDLICTFDVESTTIAVIVAHPPPPKIHFRGIGFDPNAQRQITALIAVATTHQPAVIMGDFNTWEQTATYADLQAAGLIDAFRSARRDAGPTLPVRLGPWRRLQGINRIMRWIPLLPFLRVDYIWHTHAIQTLDAWVGPDAGSDHLPVLARLAIGSDPVTP